MGKLVLKNRCQSKVTIVDNTFIDRYMARANGEFVKVYLFLLRHTGSSDLSVSMIADCLDNTEKDILRALNYWEKEGLLAVGYDADGSVCELALSDISPEESGRPSPADTVPEEKTEALKRTDSSSDTRSSGTHSQQTQQRKREEFKQLLFVTEQYLGRPLTRTDTDAVAYFFDTLGFSPDLIEYLIEYCVENGHKSMHYIQKVALAWAEAKVATVDEARAHSSIYNKNCYTVLNAFGIRGRGPAASEVVYIRKWTEQYGFTLDIIKEACDRTMNAIHQPSFDYTDKILEKWLKQHVRHFSDIARVDTDFQQKKEAKQKAAADEKAAKRPTSAPARPVTKNKFHNFTGRSYDLDSLEERLLNVNQ